MSAVSLSQMFLHAGVVSADQLRIAETESRRSGQRLEDVLLTSGFITSTLLRDLRGQWLGKSVVELHQLEPDASVLSRVPVEVARRYVLLPLAWCDQRQQLTLAMSRSDDIEALDALRALLPIPSSFEIQLARDHDIQQAIDRLYGVELSIDEILHELDTEDSDTRGSVMQKDHTQPVIRLVDALLTDATRRRASDIHFEPATRFLRIRYRLDGVLRQIRSLHRDYWAAMLVRLKVLSGLDIAETRAPQDGRISVQIDGRDLDFRVSCFPTIGGESVVIRILERSAVLRSLSSLGFDADIRQRLVDRLQRPHGLLLVTGPTGSGKSTTLYALLNELVDESLNIMTLEDPVEYHLPMVRQTSINPAGKLDFATGVRAMLRQDPDVILVGETRDAETAAMVMRASLTGHRVLTTLHANSTLGALARLQELDVNLTHLAGNLLGIVAQRLVRVLCAQCKVPAASPKWVTGLPASPDSVFTAVGCRHCAGIGYVGRQAVLELFVPDSGFDRMLANGASVGELSCYALEHGHCPMAERGRRRVYDGTTSWNEL